MALEDAWVLAHCLGAAATPAGVAGYQALREAQVRRIVAAANADAKNCLSGIRRDIAHAGLRLVQAGSRPQPC